MTPRDRVHTCVPFVRRLCVPCRACVHFSARNAFDRSLCACCATGGVFESAVLMSVLSEDLVAFDLNVAQAKTYYNDYWCDCRFFVFRVVVVVAKFDKRHSRLTIINDTQQKCGTVDATTHRARSEHDASARAEQDRRLSHRTRAALAAVSSNAMHSIRAGTRTVRTD